MVRVAPGVRPLLHALAGCLVTVVASAGNYYVDAVHGDDAHSGTSESDAWRTITHAVAAAPPGEQTIHVAAGVYDSVLGESFPIRMRPLVGLVASAGRASTFLDGGCSNVDLVQFLVDEWGTSYDERSRIEGFSLRDAGTGILIKVDTWASAAPAVKDLSIREMTDEGMALLALGYGGLSPTIDEVVVEGCGKGLLLDHGLSDIGEGDVVVRDSIFRKNLGDGVDIDYSADEINLKTRFERCRFERNGGNGIRIESSNPVGVFLRLSDSLVAGNRIDGVRIEDHGGLFAVRYLYVDRCTITGNTSAGLRFAGPGTDSDDHGLLNSCLIYGNGDDIVDPIPTIQSIAYCDIGDGDHSGTNGNFSADPLFVDAAAGDWRLKFGSPCVEMGNPDTVEGTLDLSGLARPIDGNLDTRELPDIGAHELATLRLLDEPHLGATIHFELWGNDGETARLYVALGGLVHPPRHTRFGEFDLDTATLAFVGIFPTGSSVPGIATYDLPSTPEWIGSKLSFQALSTRATSGLPPVATTNPIEITILP